MVLQFVAGLLKSSSSDIFMKLLPKSTREIENYLSSEPKTLTSWPAAEEDKHLAVQVCKCLYEINDEQQTVLQNKIKKITLNSVDFRAASLAPIDLAAVLNFLENAVEVLYINLSFNEFGDLGAKEVKNFIVNRERKLKWLILSFNNFIDKAAEDLAAARKHNNCKLKRLNLFHNNLTDKAAKDLAAALEHRNRKLKRLYLGANNFTEEGCQDLTDAGKHSNCKVYF